MLFRIQIEFDIKKEEKLKWFTEITEKINKIFDEHNVSKLDDFSIEFIEINGD